MKLIEKDTKATYEVYLTKVAGEEKQTCPVCSHTRKKKTDKCFSFNHDKEIGACSHCGCAFYKFKEFEKTEYTKPNTKKLTAISEPTRLYLKSRKITDEALIKCRVASDNNDSVVFGYFENGIIVNYKSRPLDSKKFFQSKDGKQTMYNIDNISKDYVIIAEGEIDVLSWVSAGYDSAISVPQGAPNVNDKNIDKKLAGVFNCFDLIENCNTIYLSVDSDDNGVRLQKELIRIFTAEKIKIINHFDCKDANEILTKYGADKLKDAYNLAIDIPVDGVFKANDFKTKIIDNWQNGQPLGTTTYFNSVDDIWKHRLGEVTVWTGYNNEGKSLFLKQLLLLKSKYEGWKHAIFSPEELPLNEFYTDLIESYIGKSCDKSQAYYNNYMSEEQLNEGIDFVNEHFITVNPPDDHSVDELLKKFSYVIRKNNVKTVTFDPYNQIHHKMQTGEREDLYISRFMAKLKKFAVDHNIAVHLVAHQVTPFVNKNEDYPQPNIYKIKGGGTFGDKADNVVIVWREHRNTEQSNTEVKIISQKIKKQKLTGKPGTANLDYNFRVNRYTENGRSPFDAPMIIDKESIEELYEDAEINFNEEEEAPF